MDGSSSSSVEALQSVGFEEQNALRNFFEVREPIFYRDSSRDVEIAALPLDDYRVTVMIDYNSPVLGSQHASITDIKQFPKETVKTVAYFPPQQYRFRQRSTVSICYEKSPI